MSEQVSTPSDESSPSMEPQGPTGPSGQSDVDSNALDSPPEPSQSMALEKEVNTPSLEISSWWSRPAGRRLQIRICHNEKLRERSVINAERISNSIEFRTNALQEKNTLLANLADDRETPEDKTERAVPFRLIQKPQMQKLRQYLSEERNHGLPRPRKTPSNSISSQPQESVSPIAPFRSEPASADTPIPLTTADDGVDTTDGQNG